ADRRRARVSSRHWRTHGVAQDQDRQYFDARGADSDHSRDRRRDAHGDDGCAVHAYRTHTDQRYRGGSRRARQWTASSPWFSEKRVGRIQKDIAMHQFRSIPQRQGLYDPAHEHDACGVGFVVNVKGVRSHDILQKGLQVLDNLTHRGACGCDPRTGDGAGVLMQIPHEFFEREADRLGFALPALGSYGVGQLFLPLDPVRRRLAGEMVERVVREEGPTLGGWREVPIGESACGDIARRGLPAIRQVFIKASGGIEDAEALERKLYVIRKRVTNEAASLALKEGELFYVCSLSAATIVYKGQLISNQIPQFYLDLGDPAITTALVMVHQRFSTNTFPSWDRAHPYRFLCHNG